MRSKASCSMGASTSARETRGLVVDLDLHAEQGRAVGLALRVGLERNGPSAAERLVEKEVERAEVRQLEALDPAAAYALEVTFDGVGRDPLDKDRIELGSERDEP